MAVPISNVVRRVVFAPSGIGPYAFTFEILANTDIEVYKGDTLLTLTTDYTVTINANGTGSVTLVATAGTDNITIVGARTIERTTDFVTGGDLFANSLNEELDSLTIFVQQNSEGLARALQAPETDPTTIDMVLPRAADRANKTLAFDSDGNPIIGEQIGDWRGNWAATTSYNKRDLVKDTTNDNVYICIVAHTSSGSLPITSNADSAKWDLVVDVSAAAAAQAAAEAAQAAAEAAQTAAELAETNAETAETNAETAETNAEAAQTAAEAAQAAAESARDSTLAAFDSFDDRYLGTKTSDPTLDNDGNALVAGALYFNSVSGIMKVYTGSAWVAAYVSAEGLLEAANNLSDLASAPTALTNLGGTTVGKAVFTAATAAAAQQAMDVEIGVDVQAFDTDTAKTDVAQTFTASQRGTVTTDNDGSFDLSVTNNFQCTPSGSITLTFTNRTAGQSGFILLINTGGHTVAAHADTEVSTTALATISAAGTYLLSYFATSTNVYVVNSGALA
jgi:chemotaxis protein histidine kinase CheA